MQPATVTKWHTQAFGIYWRWKSRKKPGRPPISQEIQELSHVTPGQCDRFSLPPTIDPFTSASLEPVPTLLVNARRQRAVNGPEAADGTARKDSGSITLPEGFLSSLLAPIFHTEVRIYR
jgi:hypothetical protein